ncbi:MAG: DinB family protein [Chloroflexia bacterium]|nr:DinB family protein [Chloroflexia bacterium]
MAEAQVEIDGLIERIEHARHELEKELDGLSDDELLSPGMTGAWSGKDTLAHIARWDQTATTVIATHLAGQSITEDYGDFDAWNARWTTADDDVPLPEVKRRFAESYRQLLHTVRSVRPDQLDEFARNWAVAATINHYPGHIASIRAWRTAEKESR